MSDLGDRDRANARRRRRRGGRKEREKDRERDDEYGVSPTTKPPIILSKPSSDKAAVNDVPVESSRPMGEMKPLVLLKTRDEPFASPVPSSTQSIPSLLAQEGIPHQAYPVARNTSPLPSPGPAEGGRLGSFPEMPQSIKLVDESMNWSDASMDVLLDQSDFLTVGVLGLQGTGKSTLLSLLAGNSPQELTRCAIFRPQTKDTREICSHQTAGIDMFVTRERLILLDTQPLMSASVLDHMIHHDKKFSTEYSTAENCVEMQALQVAAFLLTVCNVVLVCMDWFVDINLLRFLQTAEMLKPPTPASSHENTSADDTMEYYPQIVFVLNKAGREDFSAENYNAMMTTISHVMGQSKLKYRGCLNMSMGQQVSGLNTRTVQSDVNLLLLPPMDSCKPESSGYLLLTPTSEVRNEPADGIFALLPDYQGYPSFQQLSRWFCNNILAMPRTLLTHTSLSERNWFHYAARTWDAVKKSALEYNRLLP